MAADLATLGLSLTNSQAIADAKATGQAMEEMGTRGETAARRIAASSNPVTEAIKKQAIDYTQLTARIEDFARAGANAEQIAQMTGTSMAKAAAAVKMYSDTIARAEIDVGGLRAAQAQMTMVNMVPGIERTTDATRRMTMMQMEAIAMNRRFDQSLNAVTSQAGHGRLALGRLGQQFTGLAGQIAGVHPIVGNLLSIMGSFAIGSVLTVGVLAGITAIAVIYERLTGAARKAAQANDDLRASLESTNFKESLGPAPELVLQTNAERDRNMALRWKRTQLSRYGVDSGDERILDLNVAIEYSQRQLIAGEERLRKARIDAGTPLETVAIRGRDIAAMQKKDGEDEKRLNEQIAVLKLGMVVDELKGIAEVQDARLKAEKERADFKTAVNAKIEAEAIASMQKQAEHEKQINENLVRAMQETWSQFFQDIFTKGINSFRDLFSGIKQLFLKLIADMLAARVMTKMAGIMSGAGMGGAASGGGAGGESGMLGGLGMQMAGQAAGAGLAGGFAGYGVGRMTGSAGGGALAGAATGALIGNMIMPGVGALAGGLAGLVGGLLGGASAAREAAAAMRQLKKDYAAAIASFEGDTLTSALAQVAASAEQLRQMAADMFTFWDKIKDGGAAWRAEMERIAALEARNAEIVRRQAQQRPEDYQVRLLAAQGQDKAAAALKLQHDQERERQALIDSFGSEIDAVEQTTLALLDRVQAEEKVKAAMDAVSGSMLNMVEGYKLQAVIFGAMNARSPGGPLGLPPVNPVGPNTGPGGLTPPGGWGSPAPAGDLTVNLVVDGAVVGKTVLRSFQRTAQQQYGDTALWSAIQ